jgi:hypothetical protein
MAGTLSGKILLTVSFATAASITFFRVAASIWTDGGGAGEDAGGAWPDGAALAAPEARRPSTRDADSPTVDLALVHDPRRLPILTAYLQSKVRNSAILSGRIPKVESGSTGEAQTRGRQKAAAAVTDQAGSGPRSGLIPKVAAGFSR